MPDEPPELDDTGLEILRVWKRVQGHTRPGTPEIEMRPGADGKEVGTEVIPHFLDLGEIHYAIELLEPGVETQDVVDALFAMQATRFREEVAVKLDPFYVELGKARPDWLEEARREIGVIE